MVITILNIYNRPTFHESDKRTNIIARMKKGANNSKITNINCSAIFTRVNYSEKTYITRFVGININTRNRMTISIKPSAEFCNRNPLDKTGRIGHVEISVLVKDILVHHDVIREFTTGGRILLNTGHVAIHNSAKTIQFLGRRNLITAVHFRRNLWGYGCRSIRQRSEQK